MTISASSITTPSAGTDLFFQSFDEERYFLSYDDGTVENLSEDKFIISSDSKTVTFVGLSKSTGKADLLATVSKSKIRSKEKTLKKGAVLTISRSRLSSSKSSVDGLTYSAIYGTRVQDDRICLNVCDVADVLGIFESDNNSDPDLPSAVFTGFTGPNANTSNILIGEQIIGETSGSTATVAEIPTNTKVSFVYGNSQIFQVGEKVTFQNSRISAIVSSCSKGDKNVINDDFNEKISKKIDEKINETISVFNENELITLDDILNLWDGIRETSGRIMIISSNYYHKLDSALVRPGRIDITLELSYVSHQTIKEMYKHFFEEEIDDNILQNIKEDFYTPAEITNIYMNSNNNKDIFMEKILQNKHI